MEQKMTDPDFLEDTRNLLSTEKSYNPHKAWELVKKELIDCL